MTEHCIIRIDPKDHHRADWLVLDGPGNRIGFPQSGTLLDAQKDCAHRKVHVLLPGEQVRVETIQLPGKHVRKLLAAAPFALEDRFATDIDELHFAYLQRNASGAAVFAVAEKHFLHSMIAALADAGIVPDQLTADYLAMAPPDSGAAMVVQRDRVMLRNADGGGCSLHPDLFPTLILAGDEPVRITMVDDATLDVLPPQAEIQRETADKLVTMLARGIILQKNSGLLQGEFQQRKNNSESRWQHWKLPTTLLAASLLIALTGWIIDVVRLQNESRFLLQAEEQIFRKAMPNARLQDARQQFEIQLNSGKARSGAVLEMFDVIARHLPEGNDTRLAGINFRGNQMEMSVVTRDTTQLEKLRDAMVADGRFEVTLQSVNTEKDQVEGRYTLKGGS